MKRLISQEEVLKNKDSKEIIVDKNTIITPAARDLAKELKVEIKYVNECENECEIKEKDKKECKVEKKKSILSEEQIYNLLKEGINQGLVSENDIERMLG